MLESWLAAAAAAAVATAAMALAIWLNKVWLLMLAVIAMSWLYSRHRHSYWAARGIHTPPYIPIFGHFHTCFSPFTYRWKEYDKMYKAYSQFKYFGLYECFQPSLMICDPNLLKKMFITDSNHFLDRRFLPDIPGSIVNETLPSLSNEKWKSVNSFVHPLFSSNKMKRMFPLVSEQAQALISFCRKRVETDPCVDIENISKKVVFGSSLSCGCGIEGNVFSDNKLETLFFKVESMLCVMRAFILIWSATISKLLGIKCDPTILDELGREIEKSIRNRSEGYQREDFVNFILHANMKINNTAIPGKAGLKESSIIAQCLTFPGAGLDTAASALTYTLFLLAKYPEKQERLHQELQELLQEEGELTFRGLSSAKMMDAVINESLRFYPPAYVSNRICTKTYRVPDTDVILKPGDIVQFPIYSFHHDPQYWTDPEVFRPERFFPENKGNINKNTFMPFGIGPRYCIGKPFAIMVVKTVLAELLLAFDVKLIPGQEEPVLSKNMFIMRPAGKLHLVNKVS